MSLDTLALEARTDKASDGHNYTPIYENYLRMLRLTGFTMLELGIGGYQYPDRGGESLRLWYNYFPNAKIVGVDCYEKTGMSNDRIFVEKGGQDDPAFLNQVNEKHGPFDLIIDDASHVNSLTIKSFEILFPILKPGGFYFVEDVHTSFWFLEYGGDPDPNTCLQTTLRYFQNLTAQLFEETLLQEYRKEFFGQIEYIHFYQNLVIIKKK